MMPLDTTIIKKAKNTISILANSVLLFDFPDDANFAKLRSPSCQRNILLHLNIKGDPSPVRSEETACVVCYNRAAIRFIK